MLALLAIAILAFGLAVVGVLQGGGRVAAAAALFVIGLVVIGWTMYRQRTP